MQQSDRTLVNGYRPARSCTRRCTPRQRSRRSGWSSSPRAHPAPYGTVRHRLSLVWCWNCRCRQDTAFPLCVGTADVAKTPPFPCASTASAAETPPLPRGAAGQRRSQTAPAGASQPRRNYAGMSPGWQTERAFQVIRASVLEDSPYLRTRPAAGRPAARAGERRHRPSLAPLAAIAAKD